MLDESITSNSDVDDVSQVDAEGEPRRFAGKGYHLELDDAKKRFFTGDPSKLTTIDVDESFLQQVENVLKENKDGGQAVAKDDNEQKFMAILEEAIQKGIKSRTPNYSAWMRSVNGDKEQREKMNRLKANKDHDGIKKMQQEWAALKLDVVKEKFQQSQVLTQSELQNGVFRTAIQIYHQEKDARVTENIIRHAHKMGQYKYDRRGDVIRFLHVEEGESARLDNAWMTKQDLKSNASAPTKPNKEKRAIKEAQTPKKKKKSLSVTIAVKGEEKAELAPSPKKCKKELKECEKLAQSLLNEYRSATGSATRVLEAISQGRAEWAWLTSDSPLLSEFKAAIDALKAEQVPQLFECMLSGVPLDELMAEKDFPQQVRACEMALKLPMVRLVKLNTKMHEHKKIEMGM